MSSFYRTVNKKLNLKRSAAKLWANKRLSAIIAIAFVALLYALFNPTGIVQHVRLDKQKSDLVRKIQLAEQEQKQLQVQSKALDGDKEAIERVAREKYGMIRPGEKVYRVSPQK
jgi:cell division protein FtsB